MTIGDERTARTDFADRYAIPCGEANARIEQHVIGAVWGANGYTTIFVTPGLDSRRRRRAQRSGPRAVGSRSDQRQLLVSAGFTEIDVVDLTKEWTTTARGWIDGWSTNEAELSALESPGAFAQ